MFLVCPVGYVEYSGDCYFFSSDSQTWSVARTTCQNINFGYDLVSIQSSSVNTFLISNLGGNDYWIGLNDMSSEGTYVWANGVAITYGATLGTAPWHDGTHPEPNVS